MPGKDGEVDRGWVWRIREGRQSRSLGLRGIRRGREGRGGGRHKRNISEGLGKGNMAGGSDWGLGITEGMKRGRQEANGEKGGRSTDKYCCCFCLACLVCPPLGNSRRLKSFACIAVFLVHGRSRNNCSFVFPGLGLVGNKEISNFSHVLILLKRKKRCYAFNLFSLLF